MMERLAAYANERGAESGWPYYSLDGKAAGHRQGVGSVALQVAACARPHERLAAAALHGVERIKGTMRRAAPRVYNPSSLSAAHLNQKPLEFMRRILNAVTDQGDIIWEPFGGLASASVAAVADGPVPVCR